MSGPSRYVKAPEPGPQVRPLYEAVLKHLSGQLTVTGAAASVGLSRLRFQTRLHRGLTGLLQALEDQPRGRRAMPEEQRGLLEENAALRKENQRLAAQVNSTVRMMGLATEWMRKGLKSSARQTGARPTEATPSNESEEDNGVAHSLLEGVRTLRKLGVPALLAAAAVGVSVRTPRRWLARKARGLALCNKRGPQPGASEPPAVAIASAVSVLESTHGHIGAAPLAKASGLSRRGAAAVKAAQLTRLELQRREQTVKVSVAPGGVRGFDGGMLGKLQVLVAADGAVPYRTSVTPAQRYDSAAVAVAITRDLELNGAPLVWRMDRAKAHTTPEVLAVLRAHKVLLLQGPPHYPRFYGQLERQNREHRAWLDSIDLAQGLPALAEKCEQMRRTFNELVPRRTLGWRTAADAWSARGRMFIDRDELRDEVEERRRKLEEDESVRGGHPGMAERLAIEAALTHRGLLQKVKGGWC